MGIFQNLRTVVGIGKPIQEQKIELTESQMMQFENLMMQKYLPGCKSKEEFKDAMSLAHTSVEDYRRMSILGAVFQKISHHKTKMMKQVDGIRKFYIADAILDQITEDSLAPDVTTGDVLSITSKDKTIQKEIDLLEENFDFDKIAVTVAPDMVAYGDYLLSTEINPDPKFQDEEPDKESLSEFRRQHELKKNKEEPTDKEQDKEYGLKGLKDDVIQSSVVPVSVFGDIEFYLQRGERGRVEKKDPCDYITFSVSRKVRVDLYEDFIQMDGQFNYLESNKDILKDIPRFVRVGKPIFYSLINKIEELEMLEKLVPAAKLQKLTNGTILGVQMPTGYDLKKAKVACEQIEGLINKKIGVDIQKDEISLENIWNAAGKYKCIPLLGDKGNIERLETKSDEPDDLLNSIEDIRRVVCGATSVPYEILFEGQGDNKSEILKKYARYLRVLRSVQKAIASGIKQIIWIHLANKGIPFKKDSLEVDFRQKIVEIDSLDRLEFLDSSVGMLSTIKDFIFELSDRDSPVAHAVDHDKFLEFINEQFRVVGLKDVINPKAPKPKEEPEDDGDEEPSFGRKRGRF